MTDFIDGLERDLVAAAQRRSQLASRATATGPSRRRRRPPLRPFLLAALIVSLSAGSATAGTLLVLRGSVIPAPAERDARPEQTPVPSSSTVAAVRSADPAGALPWALRIARSRTGFVCSTVGQHDGRRFGLVGLDGRFRTLAEGIVDGCGQALDNAASLVGARVFDAARAADVRTVVYGVAGDELRSASITAAGTRRDVEFAGSGIFVAALRGYPEDLALTVALRFDDGHVERHPFGTSGFVVPDTAGGRAWKIDTFAFGRAIPQGCARPSARRSAACRSDPNAPSEECVRFRPARETRNAPYSAAVCGRFPNGRLRAGYFFGVRRQEPGAAPSPSARAFLAANWRRHPPRTAVFGVAGRNVARVEVDGPDGTAPVTIAPSRGILAVFGPDVRPADLTVRVTLRDGTVHTHSGDTNLVTPSNVP